MNALRDAVSLASPKPQTLVGVDAKCILPLLRQLPSWLAEKINKVGGFKAMPTLAALRC